jgi:hypothetical protein
MHKRWKKQGTQMSAIRFNYALKTYYQPAINFAQILQPRESIDNWIHEFRAANYGGQLLHLTKKGIKNDDYLLYFGSAEQAVLNQNIINIYDSLTQGGIPKIIAPEDFRNALGKRQRKIRG